MKNKDLQKKIRNDYKAKNQEEFRKNLPMDEHLFPQLFEFLTEKLDKKPCKDTPENTFQFLMKNKVPMPYKVIDWLKENGGYCDCEVLANVAERFDFLENTWEELFEIPQEYEAILEKKQKINAIATDFGFAVDAVPKPWKMSQGIEGKDQNYYFQIGKGFSACLATLKRDFPTEIWNDESYFKKDYSQAKTISEDLIFEQMDFEKYKIILVRKMGFTPVKIWCYPTFTTKWHLTISTELARYKGDLKEIEKLLKSINVA